MTTTSKLTECGFARLTTWELRNEKAKPKTTDWDDTAGWIYAFASGGEVKYIGIATTVLRNRLDGYAYQLNDTVGKNILDLLHSGSEVQIWGIKRPRVATDILALEESRLIGELDPPWNVKR